MKNFLSIMLVFAVLLLLIPAIALFKKPPASSSNTSSQIQAENQPNSYKMYDTTTQTIIDIPLRDYLIGSVFAQMPASFEPEALKAQAVLSHTYIVRQHSKELKTPSPSLAGADFSNDANLYQEYFTIDQAKAFYKTDYDADLKKVSGAVDAVINEIVTYNNEPIISAFHSMSRGKTESALNAWGNDIPYLQAVDSTSDMSEKNFTDVKSFTPDEISARLKTYSKDLVLEDDKSKWFSITDISPSGTVLNVKVGNQTIKGSELKTLLSLRSGCYEIAFDGTDFKITTKGVGHCVGMSQYGANAMAKQGSNYKDLINHYFTGVSIVTI